MFGSNFSYAFIQFSMLILYFKCDTILYKINSDDPLCPVGIKKIQKQPWLYYTMWNLALQHVFLIHTLLNQFIFKKYTSRIFWAKSENIKRFYFASVLCPLTFTVILAFWPIFLYDRKVIYPKTLEVYLPSLHNYVVHLFILVPLILEFCKNGSEILQKFDFTLTPFLLEMFYCLVVLCYYFSSGEWPYPFLYKINWPSRIAIVLFLFSFKYAWFRILCYCRNVQENFTQNSYKIIHDATKKS